MLDLQAVVGSSTALHLLQYTALLHYWLNLVQYCSSTAAQHCVQVRWMRHEKERVSALP